MRAAYLFYFVSVCVAGAVRPATVHEVQPTPRDTVHTVWINGPTISTKNTATLWPVFADGISTLAGSHCAETGDSYTGYNDNGKYCQAASPALDENAHLVLYSGRLGIVVDAGGLHAMEPHPRNLLPKLGVVSGAAATAREVYDALDATATNIALDVSCSGVTSTYVLGTTSTVAEGFVQVGLVRQGHSVTQVTLTGLEFQDSQGNVYGPCGTFVSEKDPSNSNCNGFPPNTCDDPLYPTCLGFVQGQSWGKCWSECRAVGAHPELWGELTIWGDSISFELAWEGDFAPPAGADDCTAAITVSVGAFSETVAVELFVDTGPCAAFVPAQEPSSSRDNTNCASDFGSSNYPCTSDYPLCVGFVSGAAWGTCHTECTADESTRRRTRRLAALASSTSATGRTSMAMGVPSLPAAFSSPVDAAHFPSHSEPPATDRAANRRLAAERKLVSDGGGSGGGRVSLVLMATEGGSLIAAQPSAHPIQVSSPSGSVLSRSTLHDVFVEVPKSIPSCGYNTACASQPLTLVGMVATNPHPTESQTLRLSFSRNFQTRDADFHVASQSAPSGADVTGLSTQLFETPSKQPTGLPLQISKNWHASSSDAAYWADFDGFWWTANSLLRLPPNSSIDLSLALNYERYGDVPAWSHAQLSIVGYSDKWLWEEAALGN